MNSKPDATATTCSASTALTSESPPAALGAAGALAADAVEDDEPDVADAIEDRATEVVGPDVAPAVELAPAVWLVMTTVVEGPLVGVEPGVDPMDMPGTVLETAMGPGAVRMCVDDEDVLVSSMPGARFEVEIVKVDGMLAGPGAPWNAGPVVTV